jgi:hypothetical protein
MAIIAARIEASRDSSWRAFVAEHADVPAPTLLHRYYRPGTLQSDRARRIFVFHDVLAPDADLVAPRHAGSWPAL